jgi:hypothetical protein
LKVLLLELSWLHHPGNWNGYQRPQPKLPDEKTNPDSDAKAATAARRPIRRGFHSSIFPPEN